MTANMRRMGAAQDSMAAALNAENDRKVSKQPLQKCEFDRKESWGDWLDGVVNGNDTMDPYMVVTVFPSKAQGNTEWIDDVDEDCTYTEALRNTVALPMTAPSASSPESFLEISIYDHDFGENDDFIGYCKVMWSELSDLKPGAAKPLMKELLSLKGLSVGDIYFDIQVDRGTVKVTVKELKEICNPDAQTSVSDGNMNTQLFLALGSVVMYFVVGALFYGYVENWSILDSVYFGTATFTTVGYGDLGPKTFGGKVFTSAYAFFGIAIISVSIGVLAAYSQALAAAKQREMMEGSGGGDGEGEEDGDEEGAGDGKGESKKEDVVASVAIDGDEDSDSEDEPDLIAIGEAEDRSKLFWGFWKFCIIISVGAAGFKVLEGETWINCYYWSCITAATVGYGDYYPKSEAGKTFAVIYIIFGVVVVGQIVSLPTDLYMGAIQRAKMERVLKIKIDRALFQQMDEDGGGSLSRDEFICAMLVNMGLVEKFQIDRVVKQFEALDADGSGELEMEDFKLAKKLKDEAEAAKKARRAARAARREAKAAQAAAGAGNASNSKMLL